MANVEIGLTLAMIKSTADKKIMDLFIPRARCLL